MYVTYVCIHVAISIAGRIKVYEWIIKDRIRYRD